MSETISFPIEGMTCSSCVSHITRAVKRIEGVVRVKVDLGRETATIERDSRAEDAMLAAAIANAGYRADLTAAVVVIDPPPRGLLARIFNH